MNGGIGIFVKTPGHSALKTRLAATVGRRYAQDWYLQAARAVAATAVAAAQRASRAGGAGPGGLAVYWAVAEPAPQVRAAWPDLPLVEQGDGGLGDRMARVHAELLRRHDFALLIGADAPQLDPDWLVEAARWLAEGEARHVLGPARDGGFWLFGSNRPLPLEAWLRPRYGGAKAAGMLIEALEGTGCWRCLPPLCDVDRAEDLDPMLAELAALPDPLPEQSALSAWMRSARAYPARS
jgi:uncharacterized protein